VREQLKFEEKNKKNKKKDEGGEETGKWEVAGR